MFSAHLANQRLQNSTTSSSSSSSSSPSSPTATFVNAVIDDDVEEGATGTVRAVSIWTTPESAKATLNNFYYGFKYLGFFETLKWAKHFLRDFHQVCGDIFDEITQIRRDRRKNRKVIGGGDIVDGSGGGPSGGCVK